MPEVLFRTAVSGKIPGFGRRYRWFMRQQYLAPLQSVNFPGFAERLTVGIRQAEDIDQVDKLLVHAFLQDLRRAYARRLRLEGWRRTAYPMALIDNAAEGSAGYRLMQLVNDVRNETGQSDQLLVVCTSDQVPQASAEENVAESDSIKFQNGDPAYADEDYRKWAKKLPGSRRARVDTAWYLPISVTDSEDRDQERKPIGAAPPPWFARHSVVGAAIVVLVLLVAGGVGWEFAGVPGCPHIPFRGQVEVRSIGGQCIGYSDSNYLFNDAGQQTLRSVQKKIFDQNSKARDRWEASDRKRPYSTIIYLAALTGRPAAGNEEAAYAAEREELEGLAEAQLAGIQEQTSSSEVPLLKIVIANGGFRLEYASQVVDMIADLRAKDPKVGGVIGMDGDMDGGHSGTSGAMKKLSEIGLPLIGPVGKCRHIPLLGQVEVRSIGGQCIGYSDSSYFRFNDEPGQERLRSVQDTIFEQNRTVLDLWKSNRTRPYITIVYLAALTGRPAAKNEEAYAAEREELEGLAVAQYDSTKKPASSSEAPLLNVVIANGGFQLEHASQAVDMIADLRAKDPKVVGVIGNGESRTSTADALKKLNEIGLPLIGPVTSADDFYKNSRLYLQLAAPNRDNARMIGEYAKQVLKASDARLYWTVGAKSSFDQDLYIKTLVTDLVDTLLRDFKISVENRGRFDSSVNHDACGYSGVLIFAGRWTEFPRFLHAIDTECSSNPPLHLIADGSVERYMDNPVLRSDAPSNISVTYISNSTLGSCESLQAAQATGKDPVRDRFLRLIQQPGLLQPPRCGPDKQPAGSRDALEYDAATIIIRAVESLGQELRRDSSREWDPHSILPIAVHAKIVHQIHESPFEGVSGLINFVGDSGEPTDKRISLLRVEKIPDAQVRRVEVFHCGRAYPSDDPRCRQP
jgi:hypothetical protein